MGKRPAVWGAPTAALAPEVVVLVNSGYKYLEVGEQGGEGNALVVKVKGGRMYELEFEN